MRNHESNYVTIPRFQVAEIMALIAMSTGMKSAELCDSK